jgi:hypothetical protein
MSIKLVQALEGISFPCDRGQIVEYARTKGASSQALGLLETLPERHYGSMTDLFTALPSKTQRRKTPGARPATQAVALSDEPAQRREQEAEEGGDDSEPQADIPFASAPFNPMQMFAPWHSLWLNWMNTNAEYIRRFWLRR